MTGFPSTWAGWRDALVLALFALLGWAVSPLVWLGFGPVRFVAFVLARASYATGFDATAPGGILGIPDDTWQLISGAPTDKRSAAYSGFFAARFTQAAMATDFRWWLLAVPVYGWGVWAHLWSAGASQSAAASIFAYAWTRGVETWRAALVWRLLTAPLAVPLGWAAWRRVWGRR